MNRLLRIGLDLFPLVVVKKALVKKIVPYYCQLEVIGLECFRDMTGPVIFAGNHQGYFDGPVLLAAINQPIRFMVGQEIGKWPIVGTFLRLSGHIFIHRRHPRKALERATDLLGTGVRVCIFPEGQLTLDGKIGRFHPGVIYLQRKSRCPIIPFAIEGGFEAWPWGKRLPKRHPIRIRFGAPVMLDPELAPVEAAERLRSRVEDLKRQLQVYNEADSSPLEISDKMKRVWDGRLFGTR